MSHYVETSLDTYTTGRTTMEIGGKGWELLSGRGVEIELGNSIVFL